MKSKEWLADPAGAQLPDSDSLQADACGPGYSYEKSGDNRARRKRRDRETSQGCGADIRKTGARVDDLPDQFSFAKRNERCVV
jgi:hypothetical protein